MTRGPQETLGASVGHESWPEREEGGFTLLEVIVALGLISVVIASLGVFFSNSIATSRYQSQEQAATRVAEAGMELARGLGGPALLAGRAQCGTCATVSALAGSYLTGTVRWDAAVAGATTTVPFPSQPDSVTVDGIAYQRYWLVGQCWQAAAGGVCSTNSALPVPMVRLVVAVVWADKSCAANQCVRAATELFSNVAVEPVFP